MSAITWSETLALRQPQMDQTHREFVDLLQALDRAADEDRAALGACYRVLLDHTVAHFEQEERWMASLGFAADNCHAFQHAHVLGVLRDLHDKLLADGGGTIAHMLVAELSNWFVAHAQLMDAALAQTMAERGFDPETGTQLNPAAANEPLITGCGAGSCSDAPSACG